MMLIERHCAACGATLYDRKQCDIRKFCNSKCQAAYHARKRQQAAEKAAEAAKRRKTLIPESQCRKCIYGCVYGGRFGCGYVFETGTPRLLLHPEGLTSECKEFTPKKRKKPRYGD